MEIKKTPAKPAAKPAAKSAAKPTPAPKAPTAKAPAKPAASIPDVKKDPVNSRTAMMKKVFALIPNKVDNDVVVKTLDLMRKEQKLLHKDFSANLKQNETNFKKHGVSIKEHNGYIEDQNNYTDMAYGEATMQYSGCEIFATFNALYNITGGYPIALPKMIAEYEKDGMVLSGKFGTAPKAIQDYLDRHGYKTEFSTKEEEFDAIGKRSESLILTMYNDKDDISQEVHTICISKENGKFTAHNAYCNGKKVGPYPSVSHVMKNINGGKVKGISLIGIKKA